MGKYAVNGIDNQNGSIDKINKIINKLNEKYKINNSHIEAGDILFWNKDYNAFQIKPKLVELCKEKGINSTYGRSSTMDGKRRINYKRWSRANKHTNQSKGIRRHRYFKKYWRLVI